MAYSMERAAERAGVAREYVAHLVELGLAGGDDGLSDGDIRRVQVVRILEQAGMSVEGVAELVRRGLFPIDFIDAAGYQVFAALSDTTFAQLAERTGVSVELLMSIREAFGGRPPSGEDRVREDELEVVPLVELQHELGFGSRAIELAIRVYGDSLRRITETEAEWWRSEIQGPMLARGASDGDIGQLAGELSPRLAKVSDRAILAMYHAQQRIAWSVNIVNGIAAAMERAGLHVREERPPALCFIDIAGYTRLTQERGDTAAAEVAETLGRIVQRIANEHQGRAIKWLGDGVMLHFPAPGQAVDAATAILAALEAASLPPAHIGIHAGPVVFQEGDFYGQTVNIAARIGEYARPGEVLVSEAVTGAASTLDDRFEDVGGVELKGVAGEVHLFSVRR